MLADALDEQRRLVELLDGLQALARGDAMAIRREPVDLTEVVARAAAGTELSLPDAAGDRARAGRRVCACSSPTSSPTRTATAGGSVWVSLTEAAVLTVDDDGAGIPSEDRERIFEPFERLADAAEREGSGLGLALVAQQAREHGATAHRVGLTPRRRPLHRRLQSTERA